MTTFDNCSGCELCHQPGGLLIVRAANWRVVRVIDADFPAFYRVIWNAHVAEFSELSTGSRAECMEVVACVETVLRTKISPTKVNLAALGNMVPHLHWHIIARFNWDSHFPLPIWAARQREVSPSAESRLALPIQRLDFEQHDALRMFFP